ncbi:ATP-binding protein [Sphaerisporangium sp. NBC_01403]|uniref:ATP-binding protein n=1 Tax=Sphaerisporangium sp. NBC_01403 TaxID=2903599 RepID=UPI0032457D72
MTGTRRRQQYLEFLAHPNAPSQARRHVRAVLSNWDIHELIDTAELIASELVTNAIRAVQDIGTHNEPAHGSAEIVWIDLYLQDANVVLEVWDPSVTAPALKSPEPDDEGGRGLCLVDTLATTWGYRWPTTGGKIVWCTLPARRGSQVRVR